MNNERISENSDGYFYDQTQKIGVNVWQMDAKKTWKMCLALR